MYKLKTNSLSLLTILVLALALVNSSQAQPTDYQYIYDSRGQLVKAIDSSGVMIEYIYDEVGNMLEVKRTLVNGLAIFGFTPTLGPEGINVDIQGQGFGTLPGDNTVTFNGASAQVNSASPKKLNVTVPIGATTGPIGITVGTQSAFSTAPFTVIGQPLITSISPNVMLVGSTVTLQVQGVNLTGTGFKFQPALPTLPIINFNVNPGGAGASLSVIADATAVGTSFVLVANNLAGSSSAVAGTGNTVQVVAGGGDLDLDGLSNANEIALGTNPSNPDTDGDGWPDGVEVQVGSDPLNPASVPKQLVVANPPNVIIVRPGTGDAGGLPFNTTIAAPPSITVVLPGTGDAGGLQMNPTVAKPPVTLIIGP